jgi:hypothetical protein
MKELKKLDSTAQGVKKVKDDAREAKAGTGESIEQCNDVVNNASSGGQGGGDGDTGGDGDDDDGSTDSTSVSRKSLLYLYCAVPVLCFRVKPRVDVESRVHVIIVISASSNTEHHRVSLTRIGDPAVHREPEEVGDRQG